METKLKWLNVVNGADKVITNYINEVRDNPEWKDYKLNAVYMGIAYGGDVEACAKLWKQRNDNFHVYGYDTFEDMHPRQLSKSGTDFQATCMDYWYSHKDYGVNNLSHEYQTKVLEQEGLKNNTTLIKGLVHQDSCKDIDRIHLCLLDMDIYESMKIGYEAVKNKIVPGGYLMMHDTIPPKHIPEVSEWCYHGQVLGEDRDMWTIDGEHINQFLTILKRNA